LLLEAPQEDRPMGWNVVLACLVGVVLIVLAGRIRRRSLPRPMPRQAPPEADFARLHSVDDPESPGASRGAKDSRDDQGESSETTPS
jgi:hypothetical protein